MKLKLPHQQHHHAERVEIKLLSFVIFLISYFFGYFLIAVREWYGFNSVIDYMNYNNNNINSKVLYIWTSMKTNISPNIIYVFTQSLCYYPISEEEI